jgi:Protein of unknown function (DUF3224)
MFSTITGLGIAAASSRSRRFLLLASVAVVLAAACASGASASAPMAVSGTFTTTSATLNIIREAGGNTIIDLTSTVAYTGTFTGTSTVHGILIFHSDGVGAQFPPWRANFHDVEVFTGTVNGVPGTVTFNLNGSNDPAAAVKATDTIVSATGDLAGLSGVLSQDGTVGPGGPVGTYTGQIQFGSP